MGKVITYYLIDDELIKRVNDKSFNLIEYINDELLNFHEYRNEEFWRCGIEFGTGVMAWHPTIELLKILDSSEEKIIEKILNVEKFGGFDGPPYLIKPSDVKKVWTELKKISVDLVEQSISDEKIINLIKEKKGYRMESIQNETQILLEFMELFKAFYQAQIRNKAIVIAQS